MKYINYNGNIHPEHEPLMPVSNRGFRYGDSFFETMAMFNRRVPLLDYHWSRLEFTAEVLGMVLPKRFTIETLETMLLDLAAVNEGLQNARVRLQVYRKGGGLYLPDEDDAGYTISIDKLDNSCFECGKGLVVGLRDDCYKPTGMVSDLKNSNALNYVLAARFAKAEGWDECILLNHADSICEALHSNIFIVKNDRFITPNLDSGCVNGVMRTVLLSVLDEAAEERVVSPEELLNADEILLTNAVRGVQWVSQYHGKTYANKKAVELTAFLNQSLLLVGP